MKIVKETKIGKVEIEIPINIGDKIDEKYVIKSAARKPTGLPVEWIARWKFIVKSIEIIFILWYNLYVNVLKKYTMNIDLDLIYFVSISNNVGINPTIIKGNFIKEKSIFNLIV